MNADKQRINNIKELPRMFDDKISKMRQQQDADASAHNAAQLFAKVNMVHSEMIRLANLQEEIKKNNESCWRDINGKISDLTAMLNSALATLERQGRDVVHVEPVVPQKRRRGCQEAILNVMRDGKPRHIFSIVQEVKDTDVDNDNEGWPESSIYSICSKLVELNVLTKVQRAVYQLKDKPDDAA